MKNLFTIFLLIMFAIRLQSALASHIVGGELSYTCLGNNDYRIEMKVYRDCNTGSAAYDNPTRIFIFNSSGSLVNTLPISFPGSDEISVISNCGIAAPLICLEEAVFIDTVNLASSSEGYTLVYQRCCLSYSINNIQDVSDNGLSVMATIPGNGLAVCNNSPVFTAAPLTVFCAGVPLSMDHSATDQDGDSLVYELCKGIAGGSSTNPYPNPPSPPPYAALVYADGYSETYPIISNPPLEIDPATGEITGTPIAVGVYLLSVCVKEYRNGNLLSTHRRMITVHTLPYYLAVTNLTGSGSLNIFPNPANKNMSVVFGANTVESDVCSIYGVHGNLLNSFTVKGSVNTVDMDIHDYAEGLYYFQWMHHEKVFTKMFVVTK